jgi:hypothetical protein
MPHSLLRLSDTTYMTFTQKRTNRLLVWTIREQSAGWPQSHWSLSHLIPSVSYKRVSKNSAILRGRKPGVNPSYKSVLFYDTFPKFHTNFADDVAL